MGPDDSATFSVALQAELERRQTGASAEGNKSVNSSVGNKADGSYDNRQTLNNDNTNNRVRERGNDKDKVYGRGGVAGRDREVYSRGDSDRAGRGSKRGRDDRQYDWGQKDRGGQRDQGAALGAGNSQSKRVRSEDNDGLTSPSVVPPKQMHVSSTPILPQNMAEIMAAMGFPVPNPQAMQAVQEQMMAALQQGRLFPMPAVVSEPSPGNRLSHGGGRWGGAGGSNTRGGANGRAGGRGRGHGSTIPATVAPRPLSVNARSYVAPHLQEAQRAQKTAALAAGTAANIAPSDAESVKTTGQTDAASDDAESLTAEEKARRAHPAYAEDLNEGHVAMGNYYRSEFRGRGRGTHGGSGRGRHGGRGRGRGGRATLTWSRAEHEKSA